MSLTGDFFREAHQFANGHSLYPYADAVTNQAHMKSLALADGSQFTQVQGDNKVAFLEVLPASQVNPLPSDMTSVFSYTNDEALWVLRITYQRPNKKAIPSYFLPWRKDHMMRIKLKPSPKHATTEKNKVVQPDVFVTAALQGCSIMVSGEPEQPVVYHLNAASTKGPHDETFGGNDAQFDIAAASKIQKMRQMYASARSEFRKEGPKTEFGLRGNQDAFTSSGAHVNEYMLGVKPGVNAMLRNQYAGVGNLHQVAQFGTVFGVRKDGTWRFYRQSRTRLSFTPPSGGGDVHRWVNPVCVRFWP